MPRKNDPKPPKIRKPTKRKKGRPKKRGRPQFRATKAERALVESMVAMGIEQVRIGELLTTEKFPDGITDETLRRHFKREIRVGGTKALAQVAGNAYRIATAYPPVQGTAAMICFWLVNRGDWIHAQTHRHEGGDPDKPIRHEHGPITEPERLANIASILHEAGALPGEDQA